MKEIIHHFLQLSFGQKIVLIAFALLIVAVPVMAASDSGQKSTRTQIPVTPPTPPLLQNGSFEIDANNDNLPDFWTAKNLDSTDGLDTTKFYDGSKSFKFSPAGAAKEQLYQTVQRWGNAGEALILTLYNSSDHVVLNGKTGVIFIVTYTDGFEDKTSLVFPRNSHDWLKKSVTLVTDRPYQSLKIILFNTNKDSNYRIDAVSLTTQAGAKKQGIKSTTSDLSEEDINSLR